MAERVESSDRGALEAGVAGCDSVMANSSFSGRVGSGTIPARPGLTAAVAETRNGARAEERLIVRFCVRHDAVGDTLQIAIHWACRLPGAVGNGR
jgi:hypothetical protein